MSRTFRTISPIDGEVLFENAFADEAEVARALDAAGGAARSWRRVSLEDRLEIVAEALSIVEEESAEAANDLARQMGRPVSEAPDEIGHFLTLSRALAARAEAELSETGRVESSSLRIVTRREPLGLVLAVTPWSQPWIAMALWVVPALLAGDTVLLKPSVQTPRCSERLARAFAEAGVPEGVLTTLNMDHALTLQAAKAPEVAAIAFAGTTIAGRTLEKAISGSLKPLSLFLGGKDAAYVRADADLERAAEVLCRASFANAGQSVGTIERIYVASDVLDAFLGHFVPRVEALRLGDPLDPATTLGPMARAGAAEYVRGLIDDALDVGARGLIDPAAFERARDGTAWRAPQVLVDVDHSMEVMSEESLGPVVGVVGVHNDDDALRLMNDSPYGRCASIWTTDEPVAQRLGEGLTLGSVFVNCLTRPEAQAVWAVQDASGRGAVLGEASWDAVSRARSYVYAR